MAKIKVKVEGSIEHALRQFKKKCIDAGLFMDIKRNAFYEKPSETRRRQEIKRAKTIKDSIRAARGLRPRLLKKDLKGKRFSGRPRSW